MPRKYTTQERIDAFWNKINKNGSIPRHCPELGNCWEWQGAIGKKNGYGYLRFENRENSLSHRISWKLNFGTIPNGLLVLHKCDNRICCNPKHLFLGTAKDNTDDMDTKKRRVVKTKLSIQDVQEIRRLYKTGKLPQHKIASFFGVHQTRVSAIVRNVSWKT